MKLLMNTFTGGSRNKCRALVLLTVLTSIACYAAPLWQWQVDGKVIIDNHNPQVTAGPAFASNGAPNATDAEVQAVTVYAGEGGKNVWYSYTALPLQSSGTQPTLQWHGNQEIKEGSGPLTSVGRPAVAWVGENNTGNTGLFMMVVPKPGLFETWKYQSGAWTQLRDGPIDPSESQSKYSEPALADGSDRTHLLICDSFGNLWWFTKAHSWNDDEPWVPKPRVASGKSPSMTAIGGTVFAIYWDTNQKAWIELTLKPGATAWVPHKVTPNGPVPNQGAALVAANGQLLVVYTAKGSNMQFAPLLADGSMGPPRTISDNGNAAATKNAIGAGLMQSAQTTATLVLVHQGKSSKNLWFAMLR